MLFCVFEGIQFLAFLANPYKNLENGKTLSCFFKYSSNIFSQNFAGRKSVNRKFIPVRFSWYFFHYVNDKYTMGYNIQKVNPKRKKKPPWINETPKLGSDSEVVNPKRKAKPILINETQEDDRFVTDEDYDIVIEN